MKKPFKTISTTAMAAVFAASVIVPVASAATSDESVKAYKINKVIIEEGGQLVAVDYQTYMLNLPFLNEEAKNGVKYVEFGNGLKVSALNYLLELGAQGNDDEATYRELVKEEKTEDLKDVLEGEINADGDIVVGDVEVPDEGELTVESVTAINGTVTVTLAEEAEEVSAEDFTVTQAINEDEATEVTPSAVELAEDGVTVTLTVEEVAQTDADQSVVYTVNEVAAEAFVVAAPLTEVTVESVNANDKTVTLNVAVLEPAEDATAKVAIFALDKEGEKTGTAIVSDNTAEINDNKVAFDLSSKVFGDKEYVVEVTVGDVTESVNVTTNFDAVEKLVAKINTATAAQLSTLLNNAEYFTGFDIANVDAYFTAKEAAKPLNTVAGVQEDVIDAAKITSGFTAFVEEIDEAKGAFAKYTLLKAEFNNAIDANMDKYMAENNSTGLFLATPAGVKVKGDFNATAFGTGKAVSDKIDAINLAAVVADDGVTVDGTAKPSELNAYKSALEALVLVNAKTGTPNTKAKLIEDINTQLEAVATARTAADAEIVKAETALAAFAAAFGKIPEAADVDAGSVAYKAVVAEIAVLEAEDLGKNALAITSLTSKITTLKGETLELTVIGDTLAAVVEFKAAFEVNNTTDFKLEDAYKAIFVDNAGSSSTPLLVETTPGSGVYEFGVGTDGSTKYTSADLIASAVGPLVDLRNETAEWVTYNAAIAATTPAQMKALLFDLDVSNAYLDLPTVAKTEFAAYALEALAEEATAPADFDELQDLLFGDQSATFGYFGAYETLIDDVNTASTISTMIPKLTALDNAAFDALLAPAKSDAANAVLDAKPSTGYKTIAAIVAAMGL